jgi:hypothetical protein
MDFQQDEQDSKVSAQKDARLATAAAQYRQTVALSFL